MDRRSLVDRFLKFVPERPQGQCWIWTGCLGAVVSRKNNTRYGAFEMKINGKWRAVASGRAAWLVLVGPIPPGQQVRHGCDNPLCVNPAHLSLGSHGDNMRDRHNRKTHYFSKRTHCNHGHRFDATNTYRHPVTGWMRCRRCRANHERTRKSALRANQ